MAREKKVWQYVFLLVHPLVYIDASGWAFTGISKLFADTLTSPT
jgi:hypothetical protein